jgi:hypothetical protein
VVWALSISNTTSCAIWTSHLAANAPAELYKDPAPAATSTTASVKAWGASWGRVFT